MRTPGFTVIEVLIAIALAGLVTAALTQTLIAAHRTRATLQMSADAVRAAEAGLEQLAASGRLQADEAGSRLVRTGTLEPWNAELRLQRATVRVRTVGQPKIELELSTLVRR